MKKEMNLKCPQDRKYTSAFFFAFLIYVEVDWINDVSDEARARNRGGSRWHLPWQYLT